MFSNRTPLPLKRALYLLGLLYNQVLYAILWLGYYKQSCILVPRAYMHLPNKLKYLQMSLNWNTPFPLDNLMKYHHLGNLLIKVLNWFLFGKRSGKAFLPVSESIEAGIRKTDIIFKVSAGGSFSKSLKTWSALPVRLSPRDLVTGGISWAGLFENPWKPDPPCPSGFLPYGLVMGRVSCVSSQQNPMDGGAWWATVHRVAKSWTRLSDFTFFLSVT